MKDLDYIIVGGGTAGAVLAARLTEDENTNLLLLEAGPDYRSADTPKQFHGRNLGRGLSLEPPRVRTLDQEDPEFFFTGPTARRTPQQEVFSYTRGRGLGGSSTINGLVAIRGIPSDFQTWEDQGAAGWGYQDFLPAFRKMETDAQFSTSKWHGSNGPIPVYREPETGWGGADIALRDAALDEGYGWHADHNAPHSTGVSPFAMNIKEGRRVSTNDAYLEPARTRENLKIIGNAHVDRVILEGTRTVGVRLADGREFRVSSGGEVILCAGAVHSPAILLRSGIGPESELRRLDVTHNQVLPVGEGHQDHAVIFVQIPVTPESQVCVGNRTTNVVLRYSSGLGGANVNDMMIMASNHNYWFGKPTAGFAIQLNQVFSRGNFFLKDKDPYTDPFLEQQLLSDHRDMLRMRDGLERVRPLLEHDSVQRIRTGDPVMPTTDEEIRAGVKDVMHACSTVRMGSPDESTTVVDPDCRVLGIDGLRVVDASIMPTVTSANTALTVIAMGELMAARIARKPVEAFPGAEKAGLLS